MAVSLDQDLRFLLLPDRASPFYDQPYVQRARRRMFWIGLTATLAISLMTAAYQSVATPYLMPGAQLSLVANATVNVVPMSVGVLSAFVLYLELSGVLAEWRKRLLPEVRQAGHPLLPLLILPSQGFAYGVLLAQIAGVGLTCIINPQFSRDAVESALKLYQDAPWAYLLLWPALVASLLAYIVIWFVISWLQFLAAVESHGFLEFLWNYVCKAGAFAGMLIITGLPMGALAQLGHMMGWGETGRYLVTGYAVGVMPFIILYIVRETIRASQRWVTQWEETL